MKKNYFICKQMSFSRKLRRMLREYRDGNYTQCLKSIANITKDNPEVMDYPYILNKIINCLANIKEFDKVLIYTNLLLNSKDSEAEKYYISA